VQGALLAVLCQPLPDALRLDVLLRVVLAITGGIAAALVSTQATASQNNNTRVKA
jgi:hypothetical protein